MKGAEDWLDVPLDDIPPHVTDGPSNGARPARGNGSNQPTIRVAGGTLADNTAEAIKALKAHGLDIFDRGGMLVRPVRLSETDLVGGVKRPEGALVLRPVDPDWLRLRLAEVAQWEKFDARYSKDWKPTDPSTAVARTIVAAPDEGNWPHLRAIARHPVLTLDGRRIEAPGYDAATGILVDVSGHWPALPKDPTRDDAIASRARLEYLLRNFPFVANADRSVGLSLLMTPIMRPVLATAPGHAVDAPSPGTGKSLLIDAAAILATGATAPVLDYGQDADEAAKRLDGSLLAGDSLVALDNIEAPVEGAALCQMLTQQVRRIRPLGSSVMATVPCVGTITFNGNNLTLRGDIVRRVLVARLDAGCENPELREFDQDLLADVREQRGEIVRDLQTIVAAYIRAGRPKVGIKPLGSFDDWNRTVRAALVWCGAEDPTLVMERSKREDPRRQARIAVFSAWSAELGKDPVPLSTVILAAETVKPLREALELVAMKGGKLDAGRLGYWCRSNKGVQCGKLVLRQDDSAMRAHTHWAVKDEW
jgi:putative DNA primase/helicase